MKESLGKVGHSVIPVYTGNSKSHTDVQGRTDVWELSEKTLIFHHWLAARFSESKVK